MKIDVIKGLIREVHSRGLESECVKSFFLDHGIDSERLEHLARCTILGGDCDIGNENDIRVDCKYYQYRTEQPKTCYCCLSRFLESEPESIEE